jgi:hypothetical protein
MVVRNGLERNREQALAALTLRSGMVRQGTRAVESGHPRASRSADKLGWMLCGRARIACVSSTAFRPDDGVLAELDRLRDRDGS